MSDTAILATVLLALICGLLVGHIIGSKRGRDEQWCDDYFAAIARDRARRDAQGKFKAKATE